MAFAVKDSFATLDFGSFGMGVLFEAEWMVLVVNRSGDITGLSNVFVAG